MAPHSSGPRVLVALDGSVHDPDTPLLTADDLGVVRGDGCFETLLVRDGRALKARAHLNRLGRSAAMLGLPEPIDEAWWAAAAKAAVLFSEAAGHGVDGSLRMVYTRGRESDPGRPTGYVMVTPVTEKALAARRDGLAAITLPRGYSVDLAATAPWLLLGAKTLSYAVNMAALRYAESGDAGDVIFTSAEGRVLEGPRSTVVIARGRQLLTPPDEQGILPGTTVRALFDIAKSQRLDTAVQPLYPADLVTADGVWLISSITLCARVHTLDGHVLSAAPLDETLHTLIDAAVAEAE
jgi:4-amino-4-deoxychorismate lyase